MLKRVISIVMGLVLLTMFYGCTSPSMPMADTSRYKVVCTIFPEYDWTREIIAGHEKDFKVTYILDNGEDMHGFQPSASDISAISKCDLFIYVGGESEKWAENALSESGNENIRRVNLMEILGEDVREKEEVDTGVKKEEEAAEYEIDENGERKKIKKSVEYDEHVWLSLRNAQLFCTSIADAVSAVDPSGQSDYQHNAEEYNKKLYALDEQYTTMFKATKAGDKTLVFGDRFPYLYFFKDYGLNYFSAFSGCSEEKEASMETVKFLAKKVDFMRSSHIFITESSDGSIAKSIVNSTQEKNQAVTVINSMQSVTEKQAEKGTTYLSLMLDNYDIFREVFKYDD